MKQHIISFAILAAGLLTACNDSNGSGSKKGTDTVLIKADSSNFTSQVKYTCTMHPEVISDTAGQCPKCGMDMVPIKDSIRK
jgi:hypothetical protein